jgi:PAS domain S-box-containing protein
MTTSPSPSKLPPAEGEALLNSFLVNQQTALEAIPHHVWIAPPDQTKSLYFNRRWYEYTGLSKRESCEGGGMTAVHPDDHELVSSSAAMARLFNRAYTVDARLRGRNGVYRWFRIRSAPTFEGEKVVGWVGTNTDIDESRKMSDALEEALARLGRLQSITAMLASALTISDVTDIFAQEVVPFFRAQSGILGLVEPDGQHMRALEPRGGFEVFESAVRLNRLKVVIHLEEQRPSCDCLRQVKPLLFETCEALQRAYPSMIGDPSQTGIQATAVLPLLSKSQAIGVLNLDFDQPTIFEPEHVEFMTTIASLIAQALDRARLYEMQRNQAVLLEQRVEERTKELEMHKEELEAFVYTVSHDLRAPLHKLSMTGGLLNNAIAANQSEDVKWLVDGIETGVRRMDQLIRDLLNLSRAGRTPEEPVQVHLGQTIARVLGELEPTIQAHSVRVQQAETWPEVRYPQTELYQIALNLISNAVRFAGQTSSPLVQVGWLIEEGKIVLRVEDNGAGIPEDQRGKVFELFAKLDPLSSGTGVGLAIVKRIAERHGGAVEVDRSDLGGARFGVKIPL